MQSCDWIDLGNHLQPPFNLTHKLVALVGGEKHAKWPLVTTNLTNFILTNLTHAPCDCPFMSQSFASTPSKNTNTTTMSLEPSYLHLTFKHSFMNQPLRYYLHHYLKTKISATGMN